MAQLPEEKFGQIIWADDWGAVNVDGTTYQLSGAQVQALIKDNTVTSLHSFIDTVKSEVYILGFKNEDARTQWIDKYKTEPLIGLNDGVICYTKFEKEQPQPYKVVNLENLSGSDRIISIDGTVKLNVRFNSYEFDPNTNSTNDIVEDGIYTIQSRLNSNYAWTDVDEGKLDSNIGKEIDLSNKLNNGTYQVRIQVTGVDTKMTTSWLTYNVTKTKIDLTFEKDWWIPQSGSLSLAFGVLGAVEKKLHVEVSGVGSNTGKIRVVEPINLGTKVYDVSTGANAYGLNLTDVASDTYKVLAHGIHKVKAWLEIVETGQMTSPIEVELMMASNPSILTPYLILSNVNTNPVNWTHQHLFDYAIYNPTQEKTSIEISLKDYNTDDVYLKLGPEEITRNTKYSYSNTIEIETKANPFNTLLQFTSEGRVLRDSINIPINNEGEYGPTPGAAFIFDPKSRSNNEGSTKSVIYNAATKEAITATGFEGFNFTNDGWVETEEGKCLRVLAGKVLNIEYQPFAGWTDRSCTIEMSIATRNIVNPELPILNIYNESVGGIVLRSNELVVTTRDQKEYDNQDIVFQEDTKTHIAINYRYQHAGGLNVIRIFVNGRINREFEFEDNDIIMDENQSRYITIGNELGGADIDVYGIRIYPTKLDSNMIFNDYVTSLSTVEEKQYELDSNDIFSGNEISYDLASAKYNTLLWKPCTGDLRGENKGELQTETHVTSKLNQDKYQGDLVVNVLIEDQNGNKVLDPTRSGTIYDLQVKGQGTSSMNYWKWNQRWEFDKIKKNPNDKNDESTFETTFVDLNGDASSSWKVDDNCPRAKRIDGKINWASPMQSHKMGSTAMYNDIWREVVGGNSITAMGATEAGKKFTGTENGYGDCRVAIKQLPFLLFEQTKDGENPVFVGLYTVGASKGDKPTFGYNKKDDRLKNFLMMEGCDNGCPLVNHKVPWNSEDIQYTTREVNGKEVTAFFYGNNPQWEISMGDEEIHYNGGEFSAQLEKFKEMCNFVYMLNPDIAPFTGDNINDEQQNKGLSRDKFYWQTTTKILYRYDSLLKKWVNAGIEHEGDDYQVVNIFEQYDDFYGAGSAVRDLYKGNDNDNAKLIEMRVAKYKQGIGEYINVKDLKFTMQFLKLIAASDNWAKNTYIYTPGVTADGQVEKFGFFQDDLDTIFASNNTGQKTKPYYVEEHDVTESGSNHWNASSNSLYCLAEKAWESGNDNMASVMNEILTAMAAKGGSVEGCFDKYYNFAQRYFPGKCYNEIARLLYEDAAINRKAGNYDRSDALSQCLGDQLQAEKYWQNMRIPYISSYAMYGEFGAMDGGTGSGYIQFRSSLVDQMSHNYKLTMTPYMYLYPSIAVGQGSQPDGTNTRPERIKAGEPYTFEFTTDGNTNILVRGANYYSDLGNWENVATSLESDGSSIAIRGKRLEKFEVKSDDIVFRPKSLSLASDMTNLKTLNISGETHNDVDILTGSIDLKHLWRLEYVDLTATKITSIVLPNNSNLHTLRLPDTLQELNLSNQIKLQDFSIDGVDRLEKLTITNCPNINSHALFVEGLRYGKLYEVNIDNVDWQSVDIETLKSILDISKCNIKGTISLKDSQSLDFDTKMRLLDKFGDIDNPSNSLHIVYELKYLTNQKSVTIKGLNSVYINGRYQYSVNYKSESSDANDFTNIEWKLSSKKFGDIDPKTGVLNFKDDASITDQTKRQLTITCSITRLTSGGGTTTFDVTKVIYLYQMPANVGDYLYADGTYLAPADDMGDKTVVGICFYAEAGVPAESQKRLAVAIEPATPNNETVSWGLSSTYSVSFSADIPSLNNISQSGSSSNNGYSWYITGSVAADAISKYPSLEFDNKYKGKAIGDIGWDGNKSRGKSNTEKIIEYRNSIISTGLSDPDNWQTENHASEHIYLDTILKNQLSSNNKLRYYPAASYCYAYEPGIKTNGLKLKEGEKLSDKLKSHNWFLPSSGELVHMWFYLTRRTNVTGVKLPAFDIFNESIGGKTSPLIWSSTEASREDVQTIKFTMNKQQDDYFNGSITISGAEYVGSKSDEYNTIALPVVEF